MIAKFMNRVASGLTMLALVGSVFAGFPMTVAAADTGFLSTTAVHATVTWGDSSLGDPINATSSNNIYAQNDDESEEQGWINFNFPAIPAGSTINGIEVKVEAKSSDSSNCKLEVELDSDGGTNGTSDKTAALTGSDTVFTFGGATDTWGRTWAVSEFTNANFVVLAEFDDASGNSGCDTGTTVSVDHIQAKVYYTEPVVEGPDDSQALSITCDDVEISGNTWVISGTWKAYNFPGQSTQYDVAAFSPLATLADENSEDAPDTFVISQGPVNYVGNNPNKHDMEGTWSNTLIFNTPPTYLGATLYHAAVPGNEQSGDATCTFTIPDTTAPTVTINQGATQSDPTAISPIIFDVLFSEIVSGFIGSDISFTGSTVSGTLVASVTGTGPAYTVSVTGMTSNGVVVASIPANAAQDAGGNLSGASTSLDNTVTFQVDVCQNLDGMQTTVPAGYESLSAGQCTVIPQCRDGVDNDDAEDVLADTNDPGCWTNPNDSGTYNGNDTDETTPSDVCPNDSGIQTSSEQCTPDACTNIPEFQATVPAGYEALTPGMCTVIPQCRDGVDNDDAEDTDADADDRGCWTDPNNPDTYDENDTDETTPEDVCPNDSGIQTSLDQCVPPPPDTGTVTLCKLNETGAIGLSGWTLKLLGTGEENEGESYEGVTDQENGCVSFGTVPFGPYTFSEVLQPGWANVLLEGTDMYEDGDTVQVNSDRETFYLANDQLPQCSDGLDNDEDGNTDEEDVDCFSGPDDTYNPEDDDEDNVPPPPACSDGIDNDEDGSTDFGEDIGCDSPEDDDETNPQTGGEGTLTIRKIVENLAEESIFEFDFDVDGIGQSYDVDVTVNGFEDEQSIVLPVGPYDVFENVPEGWALSSVSCEYEESSVGSSIENGKEITIAKDETVTCTFTNVQVEQAADVCTNLEGVQTEVPEGRHADDLGNCVKDRSNGNHRGGGGGGGEVLGASTTCEALLTDYLKMGWVNDADQVKKLQEFLNSNLGISLEITGLFGQETHNAVSDFQKKYGDSVLKPWIGLPGSDVDNENDGTGFVYQTTKWKINELWCEGSESFPETLI